MLRHVLLLFSDLDYLLALSVAVLWVTFLGYSLYLGPRLGALIAFVKSGLVYIYFRYFYNTLKWTILDDITYLKFGKLIVDHSRSLYAILFEYGWALAFSYSIHGIYNLYNGICIAIFGHYYFAPVLANLCMQVLSGYLFYYVLKHIFKDTHAQIATAFYLLHWQILTWGFINIREGLIILWTISFFAVYFHYQENKSKRILLYYGLLIPLIVVTRIYLLLPLIGSVVINELFVIRKLNWAQIKKVGLIMGLFFLGLILFFSSFNSVSMLVGYLDILISKLQVSGSAIILSLRFLLTPLPWQIVERFYVLAGLAHWTTLLFLIWGMRYVWTRHPIARILIVFTGVLVLTYAFLLPGLIGTRQRDQMVWVFAIFQYFGIKESIDYCYDRSIARFQTKSKGVL